QTTGGLVGASDGVGDGLARGNKGVASRLGRRDRYDPLEKLLEDHVGAAFRDRMREQAGRRGRGELAIDAMTARRLAEDRDVSRVAPEVCDVALHPGHRELLIHQPVVT